MADVTISSLPLGTPSGNHLLPYSTGSSTLGVPVSAIFQNSNNIGIGTTTPSNVAVITVNRPGNDTYIQLQEGGVNTAQIESYNGGALYLTAQNAKPVIIRTSSTDRVTIDASGDVNITGSLKAQGLAKVFAVLTSGPYTYPSNTTVKWNDVKTNIGSKYDSNTGYFTATKLAVYKVSAFWISSGAGNYYIRKNGTTNIAASHNNHNDTWDNSSMTCLVELNAGEYVDFYYVQAPGYGGGLYGSDYNGFTVEQLP